MKHRELQFTPGPRACGYFKAASWNACRRNSGSPKERNRLYALELDTFHLWAIDRPSLRQEAEAALEAWERLKDWKEKLCHRLSSGCTLERGLMTWKVLSGRPEIAQPKSALRGIVNQSVARVFSHKAERRARTTQLVDVGITDSRRPPTHLDGLIADFEEVIASVDELDAEVFRLHSQGYSFREISKEISISPSHAQRRYEEIKSILASRLRDYRP